MKYRRLGKRRKITLYIEQAQWDAMHALYIARGVGISEQMRRALTAYTAKQLADLTPEAVNEIQEIRERTTSEAE